jgi:hypothetical protein
MSIRSVSSGFPLLSFALLVYFTNYLIPYLVDYLGVICFCLHWKHNGWHRHSTEQCRSGKRIANVKWQANEFCKEGTSTSYGIFKQHLKIVQLKLNHVFKRSMVREFTRIPEDACKRQTKHVERSEWAMILEHKIVFDGGCAASWHLRVNLIVSLFRWLICCDKTELKTWSVRPQPSSHPPPVAIAVPCRRF